MRLSSLVTLAASLSTSAAVYQGFNYGSTKADGSFNYQADFQSLFSNAQNLVGTSGFASARLYTLIQGGSSTNDPTEAIPAAISTGTTLLLGLWASGGQGPFSAELDALASAISKYGDDFAKLVVGISVGSEDLYRASPTGQAANAGVGASSATVTSYITQLRAAIKGTSLGNVPVGHVDTWTGWTEGGISDVIDASDFIGMDAYPYFQNTMANSIDDGKSLFNAALAATQAAVGSKPVWITETGWPVSGSTQNLAVPSLANAKTYWDEVGCPLFGNTNTWWFTLQDSNGATPNPSFGIIGGSYGTTPLYDLSCSGVSSSSASSQSSTASTSASATEGSGSGSSSAASATSSLASEASSLSTAASGGQVVSSGSGLTPSEGAGNGIGSVGSASATVTSSTSIASGVSGSNSTIIGTGATSGIKTSTKTGSASSTSTGPSTISSNAASALSGSVGGALGAIFVAIAVL